MPSHPDLQTFTVSKLFEKSHGFMLVLSGPEYVYSFANPTALRLMGDPDLVGKRLLDVLPDMEPAMLDMLAEVRRTGQVAFGRNVPRPLIKDGVRRVLYTDYVVQPLHAEDGSVDAVFVEGYDVTDKVEAEQRLQFLVREVDHRANNLLAVVRSIINLTKADSVEALKRIVLGRIGALATAHQLLSNTRWRGADLQKLVEEELRPYTLEDARRAHVQGPSMPLSPAEAEGLATALHELATNAAKYGALSTPAGRVEVLWTRDDQGGRHIRWQEDGGPAVVQPEHTGLGSRVLARALAPVPGGRTQLFWRAEGLVCEFHLPPEGQQDSGGSIDEQMAVAGLQQRQGVPR